VYHPRALAVAAQTKTMLPEYFSIDVVMERIALHNRWTTEQWRPASVDAVTPGRATAAAASCIEDTPERSRWRFGGREVELHPTESEGYFLNVTSETPAVFVMWRMREDDGQPAAEPFIVTLSYNEAGRFMDGGERVDTVPMPAVIRDWLRRMSPCTTSPSPRRSTSATTRSRMARFAGDRDGGRQLPASVVAPQARVGPNRDGTCRAAACGRPRRRGAGLGGADAHARGGPAAAPVESLSLASDFRPFLAEKVDEAVKRAALRKLFTDPHFNVMDGLDTYIDDYSKADPLPEGLLDKLANVYRTLDDKDPAAEPAPADTTVAIAQPPAEPATGSTDPINDQGDTTDERRG
jgi:hypothetical protein